MNYERSGNMFHDDIAALLSDLEKQMVSSEWRMLPADSLHGFLTAIAIGPRLIMPSVWLPRVFLDRNELPEFKDEKQAQRIMHAILNVYNGVLKIIQEGIFSPFISVRVKDGKEEENLSLWCSGFVLGTCIFEEHEWDVFHDAELAELCLPIFFNSKTDRLPEIYTGEQLKRMQDLGEKSGELLVDAVYDIRDYFQATQSPPWPTPEENTGPKTGRNDPCPCGSGKKYKKCCGAD